MKFPKRLLKVSALLATVSMAIPMVAWAHHSFAAYDMARTQTVTGTIKEFRWGAPHSSVVVRYSTPNGTLGNMAIISGSPLAFSRQGFAPRDFRSGLPVTVVYHPNVNRSPGGAMAAITMPDGRTYRDAEASNSRPPS